MFAQQLSKIGLGNRRSHRRRRRLSNARQRAIGGGRTIVVSVLSCAMWSSSAGLCGAR
jgi:hypothetical protein